MSELTLERFEAFERKYDQNHHELMLAVAGVITDVNDHMDERFTRLEQLLEVKTRVDKMQILLAGQFGADCDSAWKIDPLSGGIGVQN